MVDFGSTDVAPSIENFAYILLNFNICDSVAIQFNDTSTIPPVCLSTAFIELHHASLPKLLRRVSSFRLSSLTLPSSLHSNEWTCLICKETCTLISIILNYNLSWPMLANFNVQSLDRIFNFTTCKY